MDITADSINFHELGEFKHFLEEMDLIGSAQLEEPILDNSGNVLIKEGVNVKPSAISRLEQMAGHYQPKFKITVGKDLIRAISAYLTPIIIKRLKAPRNDFILYLFEQTPLRYRSYIDAALRTHAQVLLLLYKTSRLTPDFFNHVCDLGLLSMGLAMTAEAHERFIFRFSFLSGIMADMALKDSDDWKDIDIDFQKRKRLNARSADFAADYDLAEEMLDAIANHALDFNRPHYETFKLSESAESTEETEDQVVDEEPHISAAQRDMNRALLTEVLRLARYIYETSRRISDAEHFAEELVYMIAYNGEKGYFHPSLIRPIIRVYRQFEEGARRMIRIAGIEKKCLYPSSAHAYPKPKATQIICRDHVMECPHIVHGWDINIVHPQVAYGWIGETLPASNYSKCELQKELDEIED